MKSALCIGILVLLFLASTSIPLSARPYLLTPEASLNISTNQNNLGITSSTTDTKTADLTISYAVGRFAQPERFPLPSKTPTTLNLSITTPSWCTASVSPSTFEISLSGFFQQKTYNVTATLTATLANTSAPAFTPGTITLLAETATNGNIPAAETSKEFTIIPDFIGEPTVTLSNTSLSLHSSRSQNITITVTNEANAAITTTINALQDADSNFETNLPNTQEINPGQKVPFTIEFTAINKTTEDTTTETISLEITYTATADNTKGATLTKTLTATFLGQAEEDKEVIDLAPFVIGIVVVFVILYLVFTLLARRRTYYS